MKEHSMRFHRIAWLGLVMLTTVLEGISAVAADAPVDGIFRISEFGAVGDGAKLDTAAIQRAIDACTAARGGTVYCAPGVYLSGTLFLKDNVRLFLDVGAVLRGSPRLEDYALIPRKSAEGRAAFEGGFLIYAEGVHEGGGHFDR